MTKPKPSAKPAAAKAKAYAPTVPALVAKGRGPQFDQDAVRAAQEAIAAVTGVATADPATDGGGTDHQPPAPPESDPADQPPASPPATEQPKED